MYERTLETWECANVSSNALLLHSTIGATRLFNEICSDYLQQGDSSAPVSPEDAFIVLAALLGMDIDQESRNHALDGIARTCHDKPGSIPIIQLLLQKGARFIDGAGVPLYQVCRLQDPKIMPLLTISRPHVRTRLSALYRLFREQGTAPRKGTPNQNAQNCDPSDHACLYKINFPDSATEELDLEASDVISLIGSMLNPRV